jgi:anaerobic selenocysteine-containing dehydrogenase
VQEIKGMGETTKLSFCRICTGQCGMVLTVDDNQRITGIHADREDAQTLGYGCFKGLQAVEAHYGPQRIQHPLKRMPDGSFQKIPLETALDEIADKLKSIIDCHGGEAVAGYRGSGGYYNASACLALNDWLRCIGSQKVFSSLTIDQSAKVVAMGRMGIWPAGKIPVHRSDLIVMVGTNPLVSVAAHGADPRNVAKRFHQREERGHKRIVIDPRFTETARTADIFLQPMPGEDAAIFAGLLHVILNEGWHDKEFCAAYVADLDQLIAALRPFTPAYVAKRAGVPEGKLWEVADAFARQSRTGTAWTGTGPDMGPNSNLAEHLVEALNVVCGRMMRAGDRIDNPGVMMGRSVRRAGVVPAPRWWEHSYKSRIGNHGLVAGELPCGIMADEILEPGPDRVRAFINHGGNPASAVPGQRRVVEAFRALDLLVSIEPFMTTTAQLSHYILPPTLQYERPDLPLYIYEGIMYPSEPFMRYTPAVAKPPAGSEVTDDVYVFWSLAKRLGKALTHLGEPLDMTNPPSVDDYLRITCSKGIASLDELKSYPRGHVFDDGDPVYVQPADETTSGRFTLAPEDVVDEIRYLFQQDSSKERARGFSHRLAVRRLRDVNNTTYRDMSGVKKRVPYNLAYINPEDLFHAGVGDGDQIEISSPYGAIVARAKGDQTLRSGVISMAHGFGALPDETDYEKDGSCTNLLLSLEHNRQAINAMPEMSGIPLTFKKISSWPLNS